MKIVLALLLFCLWSTTAVASQDEVESMLQRIGDEVEPRLIERFEQAMVTYPPERIQLIALKQSRRLELWAYDGSRWQFVHDYPIFAASGEVGPKLREGDKQVPEGFYRITELNPNSHFHLSMKLNYPNSFDWLQAAKEGRSQPGSNIFIHGSAWSAGCLAVGNRYVEELFYLVGKVGIEEADVLIAPYDFRNREIKLDDAKPDWVHKLYTYLNLRLADFPLSEKSVSCAFGCGVAGSNHRGAN
ncbi:MAG: L,D-transpeptidase family protein [Candidatus Thiodiazotropha sp. (ex Gloverina cf. vestifex)]|nr:L,D-transpeptidase family protein [Candidatus Thiodiazotropha sp. (ex Gloverina cf. vestifex)]